MDGVILHPFLLVVGAEPSSWQTNAGALVTSSLLLQWRKLQRRFSWPNLLNSLVTHNVVSGLVWEG